MRAQLTMCLLAVSLFGAALSGCAKKDADEVAAPPPSQGAQAAGNAADQKPMIPNGSGGKKTPSRAPSGPLSMQ